MPFLIIVLLRGAVFENVVREQEESQIHFKVFTYNYKTFRWVQYKYFQMEMYLNSSILKSFSNTNTFLVEADIDAELCSHLALKLPATLPGT